jgi:uncharacterized membrane protein YsdA (DUF1294 family)
MKFVYLYLIIVNAVGLLYMLADKYRAKKNLWRIPESTLLLTAALGGSLGSLAGMYAFRHKTKHLKFTLGVPTILFLQITAVFLLR